ncbi:MAG: DUF861 domain-containing protein [Methylobacteriaceae bacterium]|nr:DUF861 domain-containing protein [Methylobacteriaceae bacterium]
MTTAAIIPSRTEVELAPSPIEPSWVRDGNPIARKSILSRSEDGTASTIVWECSEGSFDWFYDFDETIHFLEGSVVIEGDGLPPTRFGPGDVLFFKHGAKAHWRVESKVRKLAFCRTTQPRMVGFALRAMNKVKRFLMGSAATPSLAFR